MIKVKNIKLLGILLAVLVIFLGVRPLFTQTITNDSIASAIILVLIAAGSVGGIVGMIICIPVYAILKVLVLNTRHIYLAIRKSDE